jgi:ATP-dependent DNA helicase RecG
LQLLLARRRALACQGPSRAPLQRQRGLQDRYLAMLTFQLTAAQQRVLQEIYADLESGRWMQRLVQGDVGAGKTVLAAAALFHVVGNGWQGVLMAPTESLAIQHAERLVAPCAALGVRLGVLVGSRSERDKEEVRARMASGDVDLVIGTHALIQEGVRWARLGLAVVDEQQRFGVLQRGALQRGDERPHVLVLSATPIPRSLALVLFGDLDVSRLDEKPPGRRPVRTYIVPPRRRDDMLKFVRRELQAGRQAYVVLPIIEESDKLELRAATEEFESLRSGPLAGLEIGLLHGRLPIADKESLLADFRRGRVQLLVSTTVIEVGIDVGNASVMIVHHPERFGLSQLHQLRGRVGRSADESYCFLLAGADAGEESPLRLREFAATDDGFRIAELDLRLRGPGDFVGTRQHGLPSLRFADLVQDVDVLEAARAQAFALVQRDPDLRRPDHAEARTHLQTRYAEQQSLAEIG